MPSKPATRCPLCKELHAGTGRCERCRGSSAQRGYGAKHRRERDRWRPIVSGGTVTCWRCERPIRANEPWDLGHDDDDRRVYRGPEHLACNRNTAGRN